MYICFGSTQLAILEALAVYSTAVVCKVQWALTRQLSRELRILVASQLHLCRGPAFSSSHHIKDGHGFLSGTYITAPVNFLTRSQVL